MPEFMEQCFHFIDCKQGRCIAYGFGETAYIANQRANVSLLLAVVAHPCTAALTRTGEIVYIENTQLRTIGIFHFKNFHIRMIYGNTIHLCKSDTKKFVGYSESAFTYIFQLEVRFDFIFFKVVFLFAQFFGIIPPVPCFQFFVLAFFVH